MEWISSSETFILGTFADSSDGGADASNRGGNPGFVQAVDESTVVFPDYKVMGPNTDLLMRFESRQLGISRRRSYEAIVAAVASWATETIDTPARWLRMYHPTAVAHNCFR